MSSTIPIPYSRLNALAVQLSHSVHELQHPESDQRVHRTKLLGLTKQIADIVRDPAEDWVEWVSWWNMTGVVKLLREWDVFRHIPSEGSISYKDLAAKVQAEESLITRYAWVLVSNGFLKQSGADHVAHTARSRYHVEPNSIGRLFEIGLSTALIPNLRLGEYFEAYGRNEPQNPTEVPFSYAHGQVGKTFPEIIFSDPVRGEAFAQSMAHLSGQIAITGIYDFGWMEDLEDEDRVMLVDLGEGAGQCVREICEENPHIPPNRCAYVGRQESLEVIRNGNCEILGKLALVAGDISHEVPVKDALCYWTRKTLHVVSDSTCIQMLSTVAKAMSSDSRLLIQEDVNSNPPDRLATLSDMMMINLGGKQRNQQAWERVIEEAGLRVTKWARSRDGSPLSVIECIKVVG